MVKQATYYDFDIVCLTLINVNLFVSKLSRQFLIIKRLAYVKNIKHIVMHLTLCPPSSKCSKPDFNCGNNEFND